MTAERPIDAYGPPTDAYAPGWSDTELSTPGAASPAGGYDPQGWPEDEPPRPRHTPPLGLIAFIVVIAVIVLEVVGVILATQGQLETATVVGHAVILLTLAPFVLGVVAIIAGWGRVWGSIAAALAVFANPLVLNGILGVFV